MRIDSRKSGMRCPGQRGFSLIEILIVVLVVMIAAAIAVPNIFLAVSNLRLRASAGDLSGLMQQARILAAKNNTTYEIRYGTRNGARIAYVDLNGNSSFDDGELMRECGGTIVPASETPSGSGQHTAYVLVEDAGARIYGITSSLGYTAIVHTSSDDTT